MKQFGAIFRFEFGNYLRNKVYRVLTLLLVAGILVAMSWPRITPLFGGGQGGEAVQTDVPDVVALARGDGGDAAATAQALGAALPFFAWEALSVDEAALAQAVDSGDYAVGLWLEDDLHYRYIVETAGMYDQTEALIAEALTGLYRVQTLADKGIPPEEAAVLLAQTAQGTVTTTGKDQFVSFIYTYALVMLLYMSIALYGQFVSTSVAAEKSSRAMELLITSAQPTSLMFGKVMGAGMAGFTQMGSLLVAAFVGFKLNADLWHDNLLMQAVFDMPVAVLGYALLFFVLGFFLYAFLYGALGSLVSRTEDVSTTTMPVTMLFILAFLVVMMAMSSGQVDTGIMRVASIVPFTAPMAMFVRITMGAPGALEILLSIALLIATTLGIGYLAAAIYRIGVLLYGKPPKLAELLRAVRAR